MFKLFFLITSIIFFSWSCSSKVEKIKPEIAAISESIYASGVVKSKDQYQAFAQVSGIIEEVFVREGDTVKKGEPILAISNVTQKLNRENAALVATFADYKENEGKLREAGLTLELAANRMKIDSSLYYRQLQLWEQNIGTKVEIEQKQLSYQNSKTAYYSSALRYSDLKRQLELNSMQAKKNLLISTELEQNYTLRSELDGVVYGINKTKGEIASAQTPLATVGAAGLFILELQVDEYDILKIKNEQLVLVALDSYKGEVFEARVSRINPLMNERSKTFLVEAEFINQPQRLYPNLTFEANIVIRTKEQALLIPRNFAINDTMVVKADGKKIKIKVGLKDYRKVEVLEGLTANDELRKPD